MEIIQGQEQRCSKGKGIMRNGAFLMIYFYQENVLSNSIKRLLFLPLLVPILFNNSIVRMHCSTAFL